jgi:hypothetical protein
MKKILLIVLLVLIGGSVIYLALLSKEKSFKSIELSDNYQIINRTTVDYYDTVLNVALGVAGIQNAIVLIYPLSDKTKNQFDGNLKAHLRFKDDIFYLFIDDLNRSEAIEVIAHETIHVKQYLSGEVFYDDVSNKFFWKGEEFNISAVPYESRPWESLAFSGQSGLINQMESILY